MKDFSRLAAAAIVAAGAVLPTGCQKQAATTSGPTTDAPRPAKKPMTQDERMAWWRDARFGMFVHWGLYAIPAGQWNGAGKTTHGEWIRDSARVPVEEYDQLRLRFNPTRFDADSWAALARQAGMKYLVITSKHHDGFCLFDSKYTDWDTMSTPYQRDILSQIAEACRRQDVVPCWYHSIMDWHHPDYLPRRPWEDRPTNGADFDRFNAYLKSQVTELLTNYGPIGVMWFDGQWEGTWTHERGLDLAAHVRRLQPGCVINNRVDKGGGEHGMTRTGYAGDFGTPEQEIPSEGVLGVDWETCMTMNRHWGFNQWDHDFKSTQDLIRKLADIASKGGNFLLNVGPTADGEIPPASVQRLREIGAWMSINAESIHGTKAGPFGAAVRLPWGRCTQRPMASSLGKAGTRLYLHVFDWPADGRLVVPALFNEPREARLLADPADRLTLSRAGDDIVIAVPPSAPDANNSVIAIDIDGRPDVGIPPEIETEADIFVGSAAVKISSPRERIQIRYTLDGSDPTSASPVSAGPISIRQTSTIAARAFRAERPVSPIARRTLTLVEPSKPTTRRMTRPGLTYQYYEGDWSRLPDFGAMTPLDRGITTRLDRKPRRREAQFGFRYWGYIRVPADGVYRFSIASDDGSNLYIDNRLLVDNDGLHSLGEKSAPIALAEGLHPIMIDFFEQGGGHELDLWWAAPGQKNKRIDPADLLTDQEW